MGEWEYDSLSDRNGIMKTLDSYTLIEILIVLVLSGLIFLTIFKVLENSTSTMKSLIKRKRNSLDIEFLKYHLLEECKNSKAIRFESDSLVFTKAESQCKVLCKSDSVILLCGNQDYTFGFQISISELMPDQNNFSMLILIHFKEAKTRPILVLEKQFSSEQLYNLK